MRDRSSLLSFRQALLNVHQRLVVISGHRDGLHFVQHLMQKWLVSSASIRNLLSVPLAPGGVERVFHGRMLWCRGD